MTIMAKLGKIFGGKGAGGGTVDAMLVLCVHEPDIPVQAASGDPLKKLAKRALARAHPGLRLNEDAYVRFGLLGSGAAPGLPPGVMGNMFNQPGMSPSMMKNMHFLGGGKPLSAMEDDAEEKLPGEMKKLLQERNLSPDEYDLRPFKESPDPGVKFLWMAAVRKEEGPGE